MTRLRSPPAEPVVISSRPSPLQKVEASGPVRWLGVPDRLETSPVPERRFDHSEGGGLQGRGLKKLVQLFRLVLASVSVRR